MKPIAKILAIVFLLGSLLPRTDFSQLTKLKDLTDHFQLHVEVARLADQEVSLRKFLYDHFANPNSHQHPGGEHQQLPLHSCSVSVLAMAVFSETPPTLGIEAPTSVSPVYLDQFHLDGYTLVIDHPPAA